MKYVSMSMFEGEDLYTSIESKCCNICFNIIKNHIFVGCNKRTDIYVMPILFQYNDVN
ncbi:hypothetical protein CLLU_36970 [Clostridium luticellarii]|uniref:Uncharacterized protein n=1 Tax=Clostridium luticellarii TaxID=1691940 RepID=A0A2T0B1F8_9CLOT|nr:hypothetical protein CLLU_36970 [Clostridium luticellarii]